MARTTRRAPSSRAPRGPSGRVTRSKKTHVDDTENVELQLNTQLRQMGLYAADTVGDGNCLFRALSDQLYGTPDWYDRLRAQICDYLAAHPEQFAGFVDGSYDAYVANMRENGAYGGHVELSAFAQLSLKRIKVVQPKLVLVVTGAEEDEASEQARARKELERTQALVQAERDGTLPTSNVSRAAGDRERRRLRRASQKDGQLTASVSTSGTPTPLLETIGPLYIAYHNWEHYSSVRNLDGPHAGLPRIHITEGSNVAAAVDAPEGETLEPTEDERGVMRCLARPHPVRQVRDLLQHHDFNSVVELLTELDAQAEPDENGDMSSPPSASVSTPATIEEEPEEVPQQSTKRLPTELDRLDGRENKRRSHSPLASPIPPDSMSTSRPTSATGTETPDPTNLPRRRSTRLKTAANASAPRLKARERKQLRNVEKALNRKAVLSSESQPLAKSDSPPSSDNSSPPLAVDGFRELKI